DGGDGGDGGGEQVEGRQAVLELLRAERREVLRVLLAEPAADGQHGAQIAELAGARGIPVRIVGRAELDRVAVTDAPQGVIAHAAPLRSVDIDELTEPAAGGRPFLVVLDGVTDPHNLGAVARSALCAGATGLVIGRHRASGFTPAAVKAAAGAVEHLPVAVVTGIPAALAALSGGGVWTVGLDPAGPATIWDMRVATEAVAVVLGSEGRGLSRLARERCELLVRIPTTGPLASLNVSAAAALACFEVARRRHGVAPPA
ncbi:MAG: 23S rRNA (guanosine(2251)-2'-O)-methyltransferase RlmB, partial [Acidimicrobiales bacterium]